MLSYLIGSLKIEPRILLITLELRMILQRRVVGEHSYIKYFLNIVFASKISSKLSDSLLPLCEKKG